MKKIFFTIIIALCVMPMAQAQKFTLSSNKVSINVKAGTDDAEGHVTVSNPSTVAKKMRWTRNVTCTTTGWETAVCDFVCWAAAKSTNDFTLDAGQKIDLILHAYPNGKDGSLKATLNLSDLADPNTIEAITYNFNDCIIIGVNDAEIATIQLAPNPASSFFNISNNTLVNSIEITNSIGQRMATYRYQDGSTYDIANFGAGFYLVHLIDEKGVVLKSERLIVN